MLLVNLEPRHGGNLPGEKTQNVSVEAEAQKASRNWQQQRQPPPMESPALH
jgi:hypothetical protein